MRERRLRLCILAVALCILLAMPLLAATNEITSATMVDKAYPTEAGEPIFTLHLVVMDIPWNPIPLLRTQYFAQGLEDIGIEAVIHEVPSFFDILQPGQPPGAPTLTVIPTGGFQPYTYDGRGVMWCGREDPDFASDSGYGNEWDSLLWKSFIVSPGSEVMTYSIRYDTEAEWDFVYVQVSTNDGATWTTLKSYDGISDTNGDGIADFVEDQVDLPVGQNVKVGFRFTSDVGWSDADLGYDSNFGACMLDYVQLTGYPMDDFELGDDGWESLIEGDDIYRSWGFDITLYAVNMFDGVYSPYGLIMGTCLDEEFHGYCNPEYDALFDALDNLGIDWNANFPDPPDLETDSGDHALDLIETLQEMWLDEHPRWILWNRAWAGGQGTGFPVAVPNHRNPHLANPLVRQAINYAIPRQEMMEETGASWAELTVVQTPLAPAHPGFDERFLPEYSPAEGRELLRQAGYPIDEDGFIDSASQVPDSGPVVIARDAVIPGKTRTITTKIQ
jgi:hypothetical protein